MERKPTFYNVERKRQLGFSNERATRQTITGSKELMQRLKLETKLDLHRGCVNTISWNDSGYRILSGADDKQLCISDPYHRKKLTTIDSGHRANIFSAKFMPCCNDSQIISCSGDGQIAFNDVEKTSQHGQHIFNCHYGTAYEVVTVPNDPYTFLTCGEDGTVRWFDLRIKNRCMKEDCREDVLINCRRAVTSLAINPIMPYHLGVGCSDSSVRVYDRRMLGTRSTGNYSGRGVQGMFCRFCPSHLQNKYSRPTSLQYAATGDELLVSYSSDYIYLFSTDGPQKEPARAKQEGLSERGLQAAAASRLPDEEENPVVNPIKRLRLRGDWSDTGPKARPRGEQAETQPRLTFIQRMSEMLTRWLDDSTANLTRQVAPDNPSPAEASSRNEQPASNVAGPSSTQQTTFPFSGLQRTSTEERPASPAVQQRLRDIMTSKIKAKQPGESTAEASSSSHREGDEMPPPQDVAVQESSKNQKAEKLTESETNSDISSDGPGKASYQAEKESTDSDVAPTGTEATSAIMGSVQSTGVKVETSDAHESSEKSNDKMRNDHVQEGDITNAKADSKKRKRSPNSSTSSSSLTDDPALDKNNHELSGKSRSKRNSKTQRKVTREGSEHDSSPSDSDSDSDKSPSRDDVLRPSQSNIEADKELAGEIKTAESAGVSEVDINESQKESGCSMQPDETCEKEKDVKVKMDVDPVAISVDSQPSSDPNIAAQESGTSSHCDVTSGSAETATKPSMVATDSSNQDVKQIQYKEDASETGKQSPIFALGDRKEDTNPQERRTGQFTAINQRQRRVSVSGPAGTPPPADADIASTSSRVTPQESAETPVGAVAAGTAPATDFSPETPSITCSETDSDDDLILRPPRRRRRYRRHESEEDTRRPRPPSVTESRLRELFRARREAREKAELQLSDVMMPEVKMVYKGHRNSRTMIKQANFWGDNFVLSGSDCGHIFIWNRHTAELVMLLEGDKHVVNCVQPHPFDHLLATSGIDYDVKLWSPLAEAPCVPDDAAEVMRINELMLDETRDTITVPPSFMLRMLTTLNHLRAERHRSQPSSSSSDTSENETLG